MARSACARRDIFSTVVSSSRRRDVFSPRGVNELLIAYVEGGPAGFVSATELSHPDNTQPELFLNELGVAEA